ncbi:MAG: diadenylate cyclase CdaA [Prevotellaceae bacterium]|jgi:uncharacterized protein (TIGR00159 family)|nr:diadenylate cyclase CdaA [Prevotellaceae bacterium]
MGFIRLTAIDVIDIILVALLFYQAYRIIRGTAALNIFVGILLVYFLWLLIRALQMELLSLILGQVIGVGVLALIIVFQPEIRRFLLHLGSRYVSRERFSLRRLFSSRERSTKSTSYVSTIVNASRVMGQSKTGALIVIARRSPLTFYTETGEIIDAKLSARLLENIFFKNSPLHDGAVVINGERIVAARCILPSTDNPNIPAYMGMRHRAAIGLTEHADAIIVVVSEERGSISLVSGGNIDFNVPGEELEDKLTKMIQSLP